MSESQLTIDGACGFDVGAGWSEARCQNPQPCSKHDGLICSAPGCENAAQHLCAYAGQFVCGAPTCPEHQFNCKRHP